MDLATGGAAATGLALEVGDWRRWLEGYGKPWVKALQWQWGWRWSLAEAALAAAELAATADSNQEARRQLAERATATATVRGGTDDHGRLAGEVWQTTAFSQCGSGGRSARRPARRVDARPVVA
ncbi:Os03g0651601 [Oryza sativa Japonica Group]|uniref:Os03g0651601 protein n=2 Tax=Oryza sativa subsp. japonica TaxID=39947 RepID=Q7XZY4_ORYSJ|nr:hypothetical protein [Oryza sativa Japonica Group]AAX95544.1 Hypothetical gene [Oryza sativa Japonica Group]ABF97925.1 hypothetical protein LOC_Os03g44860 [Oryza sativa Japonica Group]BAS85520.1 Os03g0651601 [Oryza sativa Japonica Group]